MLARLGLRPNPGSGTAAPVAVVAPQIDAARLVLDHASGALGPRPGDWPMPATDTRLLAMGGDGPNGHALVQAWKPWGITLGWPLNLDQTRSVAMSTDIQVGLRPCVRELAVVLPAAPDDAGDTQFVEAVLEGLRQAGAGPMPRVVIVLADALRHLACPAPVFDAVEAWESLLEGQPHYHTPRHQAAQPAAWIEVLRQCNASWNGRLVELDQCLRQRGARPTLVPFCARGFDLTSGDIAALREGRQGIPFNASAVAAALGAPPDAIFPDLFGGLLPCSVAPPHVL